MALANLEMDTEGVSMFVTLEPCSFQGRTPSCAKMIVKTKVKEIYVAMLDPHTKNNGKGIEILEAAGIKVYTGILEDEARRDLAGMLVDE